MTRRTYNPPTMREIEPQRPLFVWTTDDTGEPILMPADGQPLPELPDEPPATLRTGATLEGGAT